MARYRSNRILPTILVIVVIIVAIAGFVALVRLLFGGSSSPSSTTTVPEVSTVRQELLETTSGRSVSMTVRGPIVADEDFRSYRITVSPANRQYQAFKGYLETVTSQKKLSNNTAAYSQLVNALDKANLASGQQFEGEKNNTLGICATGKVYEFNLLESGKSQAMFWASTCKGSPGSLKGSAAQLSELFLAQIPDGVNLTTNLGL